VKNEAWALSARPCGLLEGAHGIRATGLMHAIENCNADGGFGFLTGKRTGPKLRAKNPWLISDSGVINILVSRPFDIPKN